MPNSDEVEPSFENQITQWPKLGSERGPDFGILRVRFDDLENPRTGAKLRRIVLENPAWVNIVALTPDSRVVVIRQFRFGTSAVATEIPGGMVDPGESSEHAAKRELREETGFESSKWTYLGCVEPNPALQDNLCHHWLAEDVVMSAEPELDPGEDIEVTTYSLKQIGQAIEDASMRHVLVLSALGRVFDLRKVPLTSRPIWSTRNAAPEESANGE